MLIISNQLIINLIFREAAQESLEKHGFNKLTPPPITPGEFFLIDFPWLFTSIFYIISAGPTLPQKFIFGSLHFFLLMGCQMASNLPSPGKPPCLPALLEPHGLRSLYSGRLSEVQLIHHDSTHSHDTPLGMLVIASMFALID